MNDLISRQAAIDALGEVEKYDEDIPNRADGVRDAIITIDGLPSAQPERKKGMWINNIHNIPICNQCGYMTPYDRAIDDYEYGNFCPNCGADMT